MTTNNYFGTDAVGNTVGVGDVVATARRGGSSEITLAVVVHVGRSGGVKTQCFDNRYFYDESRRSYQLIKIDNPTPQQRARAEEVLEERRERNEQA